MTSSDFKSLKVDLIVFFISELITKNPNNNNVLLVMDVQNVFLFSKTHPEGILQCSPVFQIRIYIFNNDTITRIEATDARSRCVNPISFMQ